MTTMRINGNQNNEDYFDVAPNDEDYSFSEETISDEDDDGSREPSSRSTEKESIPDSESQSASSSEYEDIELEDSKPYFSQRKEDKQFPQIKGDRQPEPDQSHVSDTDASFEEEKNESEEVDGYQRLVLSGPWMYCFLLGLLLLAIAFGALMSAIFIFDLDIRFFDDSDDPSEDFPSSSPSLTKSPQPLVWKLLGEPLEAKNNTVGFGSAVALADNGNVLLVGSPKTRLDGVEVGSVRAFEWNTDNLEWQVSSDVIYGYEEFKNIGEAVASSADGNILATCGTWNATGALVKVYRRQNDGWELLGDEIFRQGRGECPVSLSGDGEMVAFGSKWFWPSGVVEVYIFENNEWILYGQELREETLEDLGMADGWGDNVVVSADGSTLAAAASGGNFVRTLVFDTPSSQWIPLGAKLELDAVVSSTKISNHITLSLSTNGRILAVGVPHGLGQSGSPAGWVRVYQYNNSTDTWRKIGQTISGQFPTAKFGSSVSLSDDGMILAASGIESPEEDSAGAGPGVVRIYQYSDSTDEWEQLAQDIEGEADGDEWGSAVSLSSDGSVVAAGGRYHATVGDGVGHVRVFKYQ